MSDSNEQPVLEDESAETVKEVSEKDVTLSSQDDGAANADDGIAIASQPVTEKQVTAPEIAEENGVQPSEDDVIEQSSTKENSNEGNNHGQPAAEQKVDTENVQDKDPGDNTVTEEVPEGPQTVSQSPETAIPSQLQETSQVEDGDAGEHKEETERAPQVQETSHSDQVLTDEANDKTEQPAILQQQKETDHSHEVITGKEETEQSTTLDQIQGNEDDADGMTAKEETEQKYESSPVQEATEVGDASGTVAKESHETQPGTGSDGKIVTPSGSPQDDVEPAEPPVSLPEPPPLPENIDGSAVETATPRDLLVAFKEEEQTQPLSLNWTYGFSRHVGCLNLSDTTRSLVMYAASHVAVLLDFENNVQKLLLGHANTITCIDCSADKRWLVTGDKGSNSSVIVWDSYTGIPIQTIFNVPGDQGLLAVAISDSAKYIITVSASATQIVSVWDWTTSGDEPVCSVELPSDFGLQTKVAFCQGDETQFATNSDSQVIFYSWTAKKLEYHAPFLSDDVFNRVVGSYSQTVYQNDTKQALTGTSQGNIVVWEPERSNAKSGFPVPTIQRRALKLVRLQDRAITTLALTNGYIITGDANGAIKFYDSHLDLISWNNSGKTMGPVTAVSFKYDPDFDTEVLAESNLYQSDATIPGNPFVVRDYTVSTKHAEIFNVRADGNRVDRILHEHDAAIHAIAVSPAKPWVCIGSYAGLVKIWNYETKQCIVTRIFEKGNHIQCLDFDALGLQLAIGMTNGAVHILDALSLTDLIHKPFRYARDSVTHIAFSHDSKYLATADADLATTVFEYDPEEGWKYLGRNRAHYKPIKDLSFGIKLDTNLPRLLTLGEDRTLVEYDLMNSSKDDLQLLSMDRIEQSAVPSCLAWYPDVTKESFLVMANDQYKYKLYNTTTKMCRKTLLAPTYGSSIRKLLPLPLDKADQSNKTRLLGYITKYKVGLQILPLDGNPHKSVAVVGHPNGISHLACSHDGKYLFTAGGKDSCVHMWSVSTKALEAASALGGEGLLPFYGLLEGGRNGELFAELENYFYFAQLRSQGLDTTESREVSTVIPLEQIPYVMRALGFYPSEQEIEDMLNEVKFSDYVETGQYVTEINLGDFIKLYVNHRPAFGLAADEIEKAFEILGYRSGSGETSVEKQELYNVLQRKGEHMTEQELSHCLTTLLGISGEGGSTELGKDLDDESIADLLDHILPSQITATMFSEEILGLPTSEAQS